MDINVYLPDELGAWAKNAGLNLSGLLRNAVEGQRRRAEAIVHAEMHELEVEDDHGRAYTAQVHGTLIAEEDEPEVRVFLTEDERVVVHSGGTLHVLSVGEAGVRLQGFLPGLDQYLDAMQALGQHPVVEIGKAG